MTWAVIFTATPTAEGNGEDYSNTTERMRPLAEQQPGFLGIENCISNACNGNTDSTIWPSLDALKAWKANPECTEAQHLGRER